jgi:hypothetical protein
MNRIGPQMESAVAYVSNHPGCSKWAVARYTNPRACGRNNAIAYGPVNRAIAAGLIVARSGKGNAYALYVRGAEPYAGIPIQVSHRGVGVVFSIGC